MLISQYAKLASSKQTVNTRQFNRINRKRRLRLASFISAVRLVKGFHNKPTFTNVVFERITL